MSTSSVEQYPSLDSHYRLETQEIQNFQQDGHVLLRGVTTPMETAIYRDRITEITDEFAKTHYKPLSERDTYGKAFIQLPNLWRLDEAIARFSLAKRFGRIAAELMGVDGVRLYHDQALYKEPGGGPTPWHQDQQYWPLDGVKCVTMWMPLVNATAEMGTLLFASGSQELGYLGPQNISDESDKRWGDLIRERGFKVVGAGDMHAGDATFHGGWVLHSAPGNASPWNCREVMTLIFFEDGAIISTPDSESRQNDLANWFPGCTPGSPAASPLNPIVYRKEK